MVFLVFHPEGSSSYAGEGEGEEKREIAFNGEGGAAGRGREGGRRSLVADFLLSPFLSFSTLDESPTSTRSCTVQEEQVKEISLQFLSAARKKTLSALKNTRIIPSAGKFTSHTKSGKKGGRKGGFYK